MQCTLWCQAEQVLKVGSAVSTSHAPCSTAVKSTMRGYHQMSEITHILNTNCRSYQWDSFILFYVYKTSTLEIVQSLYSSVFCQSSVFRISVHHIGAIL